MKEILKKITKWLGFSSQFGRQMQFELLVLYVRGFANLRPKQRKLLSSFKDEHHKLNVGVGDIPFKGWVNVDGLPNPNADLWIDMRQLPLPFPDESVTCIFSEHFSEHLRRGEAEEFFNECHRILVDGGAIRLITPDFMSFARAYVEGDEEFYKVASPYEPKPIRGINLMMRQDGAHHYIFDSEELIDMLRGSGFSDVYQSACGDSKFKDLDLDQTHELRVHESLYVEAVK